MYQPIVDLDLEESIVRFLDENGEQHQMMLMEFIEKNSAIFESPLDVLNFVHRLLLGETLVLAENVVISVHEWSKISER